MPGRLDCEIKNLPSFNIKMNLSILDSYLIFYQFLEEPEYMKKTPSSDKTCNFRSSSDKTCDFRWLGKLNIDQYFFCETVLENIHQEAVIHTALPYFLTHRVQCRLSGYRCLRGARSSGRSLVADLMRHAPTSYAYLISRSSECSLAAQIVLRYPESPIPSTEQLSIASLLQTIAIFPFLEYTYQFWYAVPRRILFIQKMEMWSRHCQFVHLLGISAENQTYIIKLELGYEWECPLPIY